VLLWTFDPAERDAFLVNEAARKWSPSNRVIIEIACARSSGHLFATRQAYHAKYKKSLEEDVAAHTTGDFRKVYNSSDALVHNCTLILRRLVHLQIIFFVNLNCDYYHLSAKDVL